MIKRFSLHTAKTGKKTKRLSFYEFQSKVIRESKRVTTRKTPRATT